MVRVVMSDLFYFLANFRNVFMYNIHLNVLSHSILLYIWNAENKIS